jgi:hypothetical protein
MNAASTALAKAQTDLNASWSATYGGNLSLSPGHHYCLAVSRAVVTTASPSDQGSKSTYGNIALPQEPDALYFEGYPAFVLLADVEPTGGSKQMGPELTIKPELLYYGDTSAPNRGSGRKSVTVLISFDNNAIQNSGNVSAGCGDVTVSGESGGASPGGNLAGNAAPPAGNVSGNVAGNKATAVQPGSALLDFGRLQTGRAYTTALLETIGAETQIKSCTNITVSALVTESEDPSVALSAFAAAFSKDQGNLSTALTSVIQSAMGNVSK